MIQKLMIVVASVFLVLLIIGNIGFIFSTEEEYDITNVKIYKNTPVWELAKAVKSQNTSKIRKITEKTPGVLDYQDPQYGTTLLFWSVGMEKYKSAEALLKAGANPDIISTYEGGTALYRAAGYSFIDNRAKKDPKFVKLLLQFGANPNIGFVGNAHNNSTEIGTTPVMHSIGCGIAKTKALVEGGASINYRTEKGMSAAILSLQLARGARNSVSVETEVAEEAYYLIVEKKADVTKSWRREPLHGSSSEAYPVEFLRNWLFKLDQEGYRMKLEIIEEFAKQGVDYWSTPIPADILKNIKKLYPDTWQEYVSRY